jgi:hypothetical protein
VDAVKSAQIHWPLLTTAFDLHYEALPLQQPNTSIKRNGPTGELHCLAIQKNQQFLLKRSEQKPFVPLLSTFSNLAGGRMLKKCSQHTAEH